MYPQHAFVAKVNGVFKSIFMIAHEKVLPHKEAHRIQFPLGKVKNQKVNRVSEWEWERTQIRRNYVAAASDVLVSLATKYKN